MVIDKIALALAIIGALNWGGIGLFGFDTVAFLCGGQMAILSRIIYALVGLAGTWVGCCSAPPTRRRATPATPPDGGYSALFKIRGADQKAGSPYLRFSVTGADQPRSLSPPCSPSFRYFWSLARSSAETISSCSIFS